MLTKRYITDSSCAVLKRIFLCWKTGKKLPTTYFIKLQYILVVSYAWKIVSLKLQTHFNFINLYRRSTERRRPTRAPTKLFNELVKVAGGRWMWAARQGLLCTALWEAYIQQWLSFESDDNNEWSTYPQPHWLFLSICIYLRTELKHTYLETFFINIH